MGINCTGMGGSGNVLSHSRASIVYSLLQLLLHSQTSTASVGVLHGRSHCVNGIWYEEAARNQEKII